jgi:hypothetical protein
MATNYTIENHHRRETRPVFNRAWCKPVNLMLYGLDESETSLKVCSPEWRTQVERLIERLQKEILTIHEQGKRSGGANVEKIRDARAKLRDLYAIESQCCV